MLQKLVLFKNNKKYFNNKENVYAHKKIDSIIFDYLIEQSKVNWNKSL